MARSHETPVTQFGHSDVNDAATAYVSLYKETIEQSVSARQFQEALAYKHLSAEACLDSRANRLLAKQVSREEKDALVLSHVPRDKLNQYQQLAKGYVTRISALELLTCDLAGLKLAANTVKN